VIHPNAAKWFATHPGPTDCNQYVECPRGWRVFDARLRWRIPVGKPCDECGGGLDEGYTCDPCAALIEARWYAMNPGVAHCLGRGFHESQLPAYASVPVVTLNGSSGDDGGRAMAIALMVGLSF
jgi:hypothetical protein